MSKKIFFAFTLLFLVNHTTILAQKILKKTPYLTPIADAVGYVGYKINGLEVVSSKAINFLVVGDWGRNGQFKQQEVADRMGEAAEQLDAQFILSTGDNFYVNGVASVDDAAWYSSFENVYTAHSLMVDWHPVLGNHDYRGNPQAEIDYSKRSRRWNMPARYYSIERTISKDTNEKALFIFLDTAPFDPDLYNSRHPEIAKQDTARQKQWLDSLLSTTKAKWKIVVGHHPLYTSGARINNVMQPIINAFDYVLEKYKVDAYFAGHEHDLQHQQPKGKFTNHFVSGAGSETRPTNKAEMTKFSAAAHGFMALTLQSEQLLVQVIDEKGRILYKTVIKK